MREEALRLLLDAAARVFAAKGFAATRMSDIASEAGVSHGLAYHYFASKDAVFVAVVEMTTEAAAQLIDAVRGASKRGAAATLRQICAMMLAGAVENPNHFRILTQASGSGDTPAEARRLLRRSTKALNSAFADLIGRAQRDGDAQDGDPEVMARCLLATISGLAAVAAIEPSVKPAAYVDVVLRIVGGAQCA